MTITPEPMLEAYVECALWSSLDYGRTDASGNNPPLDDTYGPDDISEQTLAQMRGDCEAFTRDNAADLELYYSGLDYGPEQAGHDFWLTREGHGAGFWDRYYGADTVLRNAVVRLTEAAKIYGVFSDALNDGIEELIA